MPKNKDVDDGVCKVVESGLLLEVINEEDENDPGKQEEVDVARPNCSCGKQVSCTFIKTCFKCPS